MGKPSAMILPIIEISLNSAIIAAVYVFLMVGREGFLSWIPPLLSRATERELIHKIVYGCTPCISFQIAFWWSFLIYPFGLSLLTAFYAAFIAVIIEFVFQKIEQ